MSRTVVVTGGGTGMGRAVADRFLQDGERVVVVGRRPEPLECVRRDHPDADVLAVPADLTDPDDVQRVADALAGTGVDVLVNNAGGAPHVPFLKTSEAVFEHALRFNVTQAFLLTRLLVPQMLERGNGCVLNVSSSLGRVVGRGFVAYGTAKAALEHMTRLMAAELAPKIRVNAVSCGAIETEALGKFLSNDAVKQGLVKKTPLRTVGTVEDVANAALYLCSDMSRYVTGRILPVDGGIDTSNTPFDLPDL